MLSLDPTFLGSCKTINSASNSSCLQCRLYRLPSVRFLLLLGFLADVTCVPWLPPLDLGTGESHGWVPVLQCLHALHLGMTCAHILPAAALHSTTGHLCSVVWWSPAYSPHTARTNVGFGRTCPTRNTSRTGRLNLRGKTYAACLRPEILTPQELLLRLFFVANRKKKRTVAGVVGGVRSAPTVSASGPWW